MLHPTRPSRPRSATLALWFLGSSTVLGLSPLRADASPMPLCSSVSIVAGSMAATGAGNCTDGNRLSDRFSTQALARPPKPILLGAMDYLNYFVPNAATNVEVEGVAAASRATFMFSLNALPDVAEGLPMGVELPLPAGRRARAFATATNPGGGATLAGAFVTAAGGQAGLPFAGSVRPAEGLVAGSSASLGAGATEDRSGTSMPAGTLVQRSSSTAASGPEEDTVGVRRDDGGSGVPVYHGPPLGPYTFAVIPNADGGDRFVGGHEGGEASGLSLASVAVSGADGPDVARLNSSDVNSAAAIAEVLPVPEPASLFLLGAGLSVVVVRRRCSPRAGA